MSVEEAKAFAEKALKDPAILEKLTVDGADPIAIAKEHGHEFDEEHIEAGQAHLESLVDEMSDEELDDVAGGMDFGAFGRSKTYETPINLNLELFKANLHPPPQKTLNITIQLP